MVGTTQEYHFFDAAPYFMVQNINCTLTVHEILLLSCDGPVIEAKCNVCDKLSPVSADYEQEIESIVDR